MQLMHGIIECANVKTQEAALTGESNLVEKSVATLDSGELNLGDRTNMVYTGTEMSNGRGVGVVTATGMKTELGKIAHLLQSVTDRLTPLQHRLMILGKKLAWIALAIVALVVVLGLMRGADLKLMIMTGMSMAVAAVPEGLPAVATVALALGARRMLKRNALIRKLPAVETLGSVDVICSDKTGTLTENKMTATAIALEHRTVDLQSQTFKMPEGSDSVEMHSLLQTEKGLAWTLIAGSLCNDAEVYVSDSQGETTLGDPTESAIVHAALNFGLQKQKLLQLFPRVDEVPFDSIRKRMTTVHSTQLQRIEGLPQALGDFFRTLQVLENKFYAFTKGSVDSLLEVSQYIWIDGKQQRLDQNRIEQIQKSQTELASQGMRVLGVGFKIIDSDGVATVPIKETEIESQMVFLGMIGMLDPPRTEVKVAIERCKKAGIRTIMITGDHPLTARSIAHQLGLTEGQKTLTGADLNQLEKNQYDEVVRDCSIYARVTPEHKLNIVDTLQKQGLVVSMTGDGVNDAAALKKADIGVAMGITGTDVAKESSEMVLLDDNFATIVNAVEEGRVVYDNIRKFIRYTLTSNAGEIWVMLLAPFIGMPLPLIPVQILWVNLVTDGLPGLALTVEPAEQDAMQRGPHSKKESILGGGLGFEIFWIGLWMGLLSLGIGYFYYQADPENTAYWRTIVFTVLTISQLGNVLAIRSSRDSLFKIGISSNLPLLLTVLLTFGLQIAVIYLPSMQKLLNTTALKWQDLVICIVVSTGVFWAVELKKLWVRRR